MVLLVIVEFAGVCLRIWWLLFVGVLVCWFILWFNWRNLLGWMFIICVFCLCLVISLLIIGYWLLDVCFCGCILVMLVMTCLCILFRFTCLIVFYGFMLGLLCLFVCEVYLLFNFGCMFGDLVCLCLHLFCCFDGVLLVLFIMLTCWLTGCFATLGCFNCLFAGCDLFGFLIDWMGVWYCL